MKKYSAACDICNRVFEHEKEVVVKQQVGFHKRHAHGIAGVTSTPESRRAGAREYYYRKQGYSEAEIAKKMAEYNHKNAFGLTKESPIPTTGETAKKQPRREAQPLALSECPCCGARFFVTKKDSEC